MIATLESPQTLPARRLNVMICAWCGQNLAHAKEIDLPRPSHGICPGCALEHFGMRLELPAEE